MREERVKIVTFAPQTHADEIRKVLGETGAGKIGNYSHASFSVKGMGRFKALEGASPAVGKVGKLEEVREERIETICRKTDLPKVIAAAKAVHPYEEPVIDVYPLMDVI